MAAKNPKFTRHLQLGLSREQVAEITASVTLQPPAEVLDFYSYFNFPKRYMYGADQPSFYDIYPLLGLEDAVESWHFRRTLGFYRDYELKWFPFLQMEGKAYLVDCVPSDTGHHQIIDEFIACTTEVKFLSLTAMFNTLYDWVHEGVLSAESGCIAGDYTGDQQRVREIALRHNPGIEHWENK